MNFDIVLAQNAFGKIVIKCIKATHQRTSYVFPNRSRLLEQHPLIGFEIEKHRSNLNFVNTKTCHVLLAGEALEAYFRDGKCFFNGEPLLSLGESNLRQESFSKKLRQLKFDPAVNSASYFLAKFQDLMVDQVDSIIKTHLLSFIPLEDQDYFRFRFDQAVPDLYLEFHRYYDGRAEAIRVDLEKLTLSQCSSVEEFFDKKLEYLNTYCRSMLMAGKIKVLISHFPQEVRSEFADRKKVPNRILSKMDPFKSYLFEVCKLHRQSLLMKPILVSDFMRERLSRTQGASGVSAVSTPIRDHRLPNLNQNVSNINRSTPANSVVNSVDMAEEGHSRISFPNRVNLSGFLSEL